MGEIGEPAFCGVAAFVAAGGFGARFADCFERRARNLVGLGQVVLGGGEPVGIGAARGGGGLDLADQRLALGREFFRRARQFGALVRGFLDPLPDGRDLGLGVVLALVPGLPLFGDGLQPAAGKLGFAHDRLRFDADFGERAAVGGDDVVDRSELRFKIGSHRQGGQRRGRFALAGRRFVARAGAHAARRCRPPRRAATFVRPALPRSTRRSGPARPARRNAIRSPHREQQLYVAGAHFGAIDAIGRAAALDAPDDLDVSRSLKAKGVVRRVVDGVDLGGVARRATGRAGEDHVIHLAAAQPCGEASPITQRNASTRLDLPQPFGPTMPVSPGSIATSVARRRT